MLASLGAKPVAALTELLWGNSTRGSLRIPVTLALIDVQSQHLRHCVIHALHTNVAVGVVRRSYIVHKAVERDFTNGGATGTRR